MKNVVRVPTRWISTHALREEGDPLVENQAVSPERFLPTPSARRATRPYSGSAKIIRISTHALREEGDPQAPGGQPQQGDFYPRPPRGGRPTGPVIMCMLMLISTHALREEGDAREHTRTPGQ